MGMSKKISLLSLGILLNLMSVMANTEPIKATADTTLIKKYSDQINAYLEREQVDSALICYDKIIKLDTTLTNAYVNKAELLLNIGRYEDALSVNTKGLKLEPSNIDAIITQSYILASMSQFDEAMKVINGGIEKYPENPSFYLHKAYIYHKYLKDIPNSIVTCEKILNLKNADYEHRFLAHSMIVENTEKASIDKAVDAMINDMGKSDYRTIAFVTKIYNSLSIFDKAEKYKKIAFKLHDKQKIEDKTICIDEYSHSDVIVQVFEYFDPKDAGYMKIQYVFKVFNKQNYEWKYNIRVEYVFDFAGDYKSQMAVMATKSEDVRRTYWDTFRELKSTSYEQWMNLANLIIDGKLRVGSSSFIGKDGKSSTIIIGGDKTSEE